MTQRAVRVCSVMGAAGLLVSASAWAQGFESSITAIDQFETADLFNFVPNRVSGDGRLVVGTCGSPMGQQGCLFDVQARTLTGVGDLDGGQFFSTGNGVSNIDASVGGRTGPVAAGQGTSQRNNGNNRTEAYRWCGVETPPITGLRDLPMNGFISVANAVSNDGSTIVGRGTSTNGTEAWRWNATDRLVPLGDLDGAGGGFLSEALDVNATGTVIVGEGRSLNGREGFYWTSDGMGGGTMVGVGDLPGGSGFESRTLGVSASGGWACGTSAAGPTSGETRPFIYNAVNQELIDLGLLDELTVGFGFAADVTDRPIVVGQASSLAGNAAFVYDARRGGMNGVRTLLADAGVDMSDWTALTAAHGVSDNGRIVAGRGSGAAGDAFVAVLPPPPCLVDFALPRFVLDAFDRAAFDAFVAAGDESVNFDGDGAPDQDDVLLFESLFAEGCPLE